MALLIEKEHCCWA